VTLSRINLPRGSLEQMLLQRRLCLRQAGDLVFPSGNPKNALSGVQTFGVEDGNGAIVEFTVPEAGTYLLVDHDHLSDLPTGFVIPFAVQ
jgi:hypothetical protein